LDDNGDGIKGEPLKTMSLVRRSEFWIGIILTTAIAVSIVFSKLNQLHAQVTETGGVIGREHDPRHSQF
jgi:uncharacterized membrane protein YhaH (DUF805 family)